MLMDSETTLSKVASTYFQMKQHNKANQAEAQIKDGLELFEITIAGNSNALEIIDGVYDAILRGNYNLSVIIDLELIVFVGGNSVRENIVEGIALRVTVYLDRNGASEIEPKIQVCRLYNDANLIGAAVNYNRYFT